MAAYTVETPHVRQLYTYTWNTVLEKPYIVETTFHIQILQDSMAGQYAKRTNQYLFSKIVSTITNL